MHFFILVASNLSHQSDPSLLSLFAVSRPLKAFPLTIHPYSRIIYNNHQYHHHVVRISTTPVAIVPLQLGGVVVGGSFVLGRRRSRRFCLGIGSQPERPAPGPRGSSPAIVWQWQSGKYFHYHRHDHDLYELGLALVGARLELLSIRPGHGLVNGPATSLCAMSSIGGPPPTK